MDVDWGLAVAGAWSVVVAIPGLIAFIWQFQDRRQRNIDRMPYVSLAIMNPVYSQAPENWLAFTLYVRNDSRIPLTVQSIEIIAPQGSQIAPRHHLSPTNQPDPAHVGRLLTVTWTVPSAGKETVESDFVGSRWHGLISTTDLKAPTKSVRMYLKVSEQSASALEMKIRVTSTPIKLPVISTSDI